MPSTDRGPLLSSRQARLDRSDRRQLLLVTLVSLDARVVRRRGLGADQRVRRSGLFGLEAQVASARADHALQVLATLLPHAEAMHGLGRVFEEALQFPALGALAREVGRAGKVGRPGGALAREALEPLPAGGEPVRQGG